MKFWFNIWCQSRKNGGKIWKFDSILTKSVQELAEKSASLEEENKQLKERLSRLEEIVNKL